MSQPGGYKQTLMQRISLILFLSVFAVFMQPVEGFALTKVPPGNRNAAQPKIPNASISRTRDTKNSFQAKYEKIRDLIKKDKKLRLKIKQAAEQYEIAPVHILGALVGEHTYNVDALDRLQTYYVKALSYINSGVKFSFSKEPVSKFVERPEFEICKPMQDSYDLWSCREMIWTSKFKGKTVDGTTWPNKRFGTVFFQPFYAGQTFGLGQINPLTALSVTDLVVKTSGGKKLSADKANEVYKAIMEPDTTLQYMAAVIKTSIDAYRDAGLDISDNPGITATLYNLGNVRIRAQKAKLRGGLPQENYYGWLVNEKRAELEAIIQK